MNESYGWIGTIVLGLIAGFIASKIINKEGEGFLVNILLGVVGAVVGNFVFNQFGASGVTSGHFLYSLLVAVIGAVIVLVIYHAIFGSRRRTI